MLVGSEGSWICRSVTLVVFKAECACVSLSYDRFVQIAEAGSYIG